MNIQITWNKLLDKTLFGWLNERGIEPTVLNRLGLYYLHFENSEDALAFKLRFELC